MLKVIAALFLSVSLSGCVGTQVAKSTTTQSGKPEVLIKAEVEKIKEAIVADMVNYGYTIENDTPYSLSLIRPTKGNEDFYAYFAVGNAYSSNERVAAYTFVKAADVVRVIATPSIRAKMVGGQINTREMLGNAQVYNEYQKQLNEIKSKLEGK
jgi:hypothetical protein